MSTTFKARLARRAVPWLLWMPVLVCTAAYADSKSGERESGAQASQAAPTRETESDREHKQRLVEPVRIALMPGARLLVSDFRAEAVHVVRERDLAVQRTIGVDGNPVAVAWGAGRIFVGNETKGRVEAYNLGGRLLTTYGAPGSILLPNAVAIDPESSRVMVLDSFEKVVKVFALDGTFLYPLTQAGALENPSAMSFDAARRLLLVSDFGGFSDNMFKKPTASVRYFDLNGTEQIRFNGLSARPQGLSADGFGHLYVVDSYESQVQVLDAASGALLGLLGAPGTGPGALNLPLDVVYSPGTDKLYVTDNQNGRIASFDRWVAP